MDIDGLAVDGHIKGQWARQSVSSMLRHCLRQTANPIRSDNGTLFSYFECPRAVVGFSRGKIESRLSAPGCGYMCAAQETHFLFDDHDDIMAKV